MHAARVDKSERLKRVLKILADGELHSTFEIQTRANVCAVGTCVSELRAQGYIIPKALKSKGIYYYYQLLARP